MVGEGSCGALPWSASAFPLAKVTEAKVCQLLKHSVYTITAVIITVLSVISTDFNLSKWASSQSLTAMERQPLAEGGARPVKCPEYELLKLPQGQLSVWLFPESFHLHVVPCYA